LARGKGSREGRGKLKGNGLDERPRKNTREEGLLERETSRKKQARGRDFTWLENQDPAGLQGPSDQEGGEKKTPGNKKKEEATQWRLPGK